jgi:Mg2+ and Co2+ transporter CorA
MIRKNIYEYYDDSYGVFSNLFATTEGILDYATSIKNLAKEFDDFTQVLMNRANNRHTSDRQIKTFLQDNDDDIEDIMNSLRVVEDSLSDIVSEIKRLRY